jgi:zinc protease
VELCPATPYISVDITENSMPSHRNSLTLLSRALFAASALVLGFAGAQAAPAPPWPQEQSDIAPDPAIKFGALPTGMRYAIMKNATPKGEVSIRLRIDAGSLHESDAQLGLAHFLEHMAFRGSTHVSDGDVFKMLERLGLRAGADTNASTSQTQTLYQFDLPKADEETVDTGVMLAREIVSELTLNADAFQAERGPVLSEERLRDGPGTRAFDAQSKFLLKGQLAPFRAPIGKVEIIRTAPVSQAADFYKAYYRPERATLIVVGDIEPDAIEAKIKAKFGDWNPDGLGRANPDLGTPPMRGEEAQVFVETGAPQFVTASWVTPYDNSRDTKEQRAKDRIESLALGIVNQRFAQAAQSADPPFLAAGVTRGNTQRSAQIASLYVNYPGDQWRKAFIEADRIRRQVLQQGVTQEEVDRQVTAALTGSRSALASSSTRNSRALAAGIAGAIGRDAVFSSPQSGLEMAEAALKGLTKERVNEVLRTVFAGNGPLLFLSSPAGVEGGEKALSEAFKEGESAMVADTAPPQALPWPYTEFGKPGAVVATREISDVGVTFLQFENGVKLTVKPTKFRADQISVSVTVPGGELVYPKDRMIIDSGAFVGGGLAGMSLIDMRRSLNGKIYGIGFEVADDSFAFAGGTRPADLDTQLQVLAAYLTKPGWRPELFRQGLTSMADGLVKLDTSAMSMFGSQWTGLLHSGDARWMYPSLDQVKAAKIEDVKALIEPFIANGPLEVTIVGDLEVEDAVKSVAATFGALPKRGATPAFAPEGLQVKFPAPTAEPVVLRHKGRADQGVSAIAWPTTDVYSDSESATRRLLTNIIRSRLFDQLRVADGATYSPQTSAHASLTFPGYGYIAAFAEIPPDKSKLFFDAVEKVTADLAANGPTADEFDRARKPEVDALEKAIETNGYWAGYLAGVQADERKLTLLRNARPQLEKATPDDVKRVAAKYLTASKAWKLVVLPETSGAAGAAPPSGK